MTVLIFYFNSGCFENLLLYSFDLQTNSMRAKTHFLNDLYLKE